MTATLVLDGMRVPVEMGGGSRRARLTIERDGSLRLRAADDVAASELQAFLASKRDWIYKKLAEKEGLQQEPVTKELVNGEGFMYLGRNYRLLITESGARVSLKRGRLCLAERDVPDGSHQLVDWYRLRGESVLRPRVIDWASRLRVVPINLSVADLGHKWGAASPDGQVRVHWAAMQLPLRLIDYVLAHELSHVHEPHHGPDFWQLVSRVMPDYEERKQELAQRGAGLWFGGTS
jgi:predicted metal-dependent hydrolase